MSRCLGVKQDTLAALRTAPMHISTLFQDSVIKRAEEEIVHFENKGHTSRSRGKGRYHPYERSDKRTDGKYVNCHVRVAHSGPGHSQKRDLSPGSAGCHYKDHKLRYVKSVSCVTELSCVSPAINVKNAAQNLPVGARFENYWQTWLDLGAGPKVVQILKEGYTLPFRIRPNLTRSPTVISCYVNPHRNLHLLEALYQLIDKNAVELVQNKKSLGFFNGVNI